MNIGSLVGSSTLNIGDFQAGIDKMVNGLSKLERTATSSFSVSTNSLLTFNRALATFGVSKMTNSLSDAAVQLDQLDRSFRFINKGAEGAQKEFAFLHKTADTMGQNFYDLANSYKGFSASAQIANLTSEETHTIFEGLVAASTSLGLTSDKTKMSLYALEQMLNKSKVMSEELRRQLGQYLPGAFALFAQSIGVSTQELDKMLKKGTVGIREVIQFGEYLKSTFGASALEAAASYTGQVRKMSEAWMDLKATVVSGGFAKTATAVMVQLRNVFADPSFQSGLSSITQAFGQLIINVSSILQPLGAIVGLANKIPPELLQSAAGAVIGGAVAGPAGALVGATVPIQKAIFNIGQGFAAAISGDMEWSTLATSNAKELQVELDKIYEKFQKISDGYSSMIQKNKDIMSSGLRFAVTDENLKKLEEGYKKWDEIRFGKNGKDSTEIQNAITNITAKLAQMNDTGTEGQSRIATLTKEYEHFALKLGEANPLVKQYADVIAYANEHLGYTPQQVAKATRAGQDQVKALESEIKSIQDAMDAYGVVNQTKLQMLVEIGNAERQYYKDIESGMSQATAARNQELAIQKAQLNNAAEIAKINFEGSDQATALEAEIQAIRESTNAYGDINQTKLKMITEVGNAERQYYKDIQNGMDQVIAARIRDASIQKAQIDGSQANLELQRDFYATAANELNRPDLQEEAIRRQMAVYEGQVDEAMRLEVLNRLLMKNSHDAYTGMVVAADNYANHALNDAEQVGKAFSSAFEAANTALTDFVFNAEDGMQTLRSLAMSLFSQLTQMNLLGPLAKMISGSSASESGGIFSWVASLFGSANGNVFSGGGIKSLSGGVFNSPTMFGYGNHVKAFAKGGVLGEAGPEAVMPLTRTSNGRLAVESVNSNGGGGLSRQDMQMLTDAISKSGNVRLVNTLDPSVVDDFLSSSSGEKVILNVIRKNKEVLRS